MNIQRFVTLPNALKPLTLVFTLMTMLMAGATPAQNGVTASLEGAWFFWLNIIFQLVWMSTVFGLFLYDAEVFMTCGKESWPVLEMSYSGVFVICNLINVFILASWHQYAPIGSSTYFVAAVCSFFLLIIYALGGLMVFRIWRGMVRSGATQNPATTTVQPGSIGSMHPGV